MKRLSFIFLMMLYLCPMAVVEVQAETITFTAGDIVNWMAQQGDPLHNATDVWGITRVRVIPAVSVPGGYTINLEECSISSNTVSWRVQTDAVGNPPYGNGVTDTGLHASFNDTHLYSWQGSLYYSGTVYVISDLSPADFAARFPQYYSGTHPDLPLAEMPANTVFTLNFTLNPGVTWLNQGFYFLVDGVWYNNWYAGASYTNPIGFNGGYGMDSIPYAGDLKGDMGYGYYGTSTPLPSSLILLTSGLLSLWWLRKKAQV